MCSIFGECAHIVLVPESIRPRSEPMEDIPYVVIDERVCEFDDIDERGLTEDEREAPGAISVKTQVAGKVVVVFFFFFLFLC